MKQVQGDAKISVRYFPGFIPGTSYIKKLGVVSWPCTGTSYSIMETLE
ncbi:MAG: hypothetical protein AAF363_18565 [Bacteroidota bacterium]